jgi:hypothetical protein
LIAQFVHHLVWTFDGPSVIVTLPRSAAPMYTFTAANQRRQRRATTAVVVRDHAGG